MTDDLKKAAGSLSKHKGLITWLGDRDPVTPTAPRSATPQWSWAR
jgi:hypothetical protein